MEYGLVGKKLYYSCSPMIHSFIGNYRYELYETGDIDGFFKAKDFKGLNVTMPYKKDALKYCDELSDTARRTGCVNTVVKRPDGSLYGDNTDYFGFSYMLQRAGIRAKGKNALVFGTGGGACMARTALEDMGASSVTMVSRTGEVNYSNVYDFELADLIVNATPAGMYPDCDGQLVNLYRFPMLTGYADLVYNPARTAACMEAEKNYVRNTGGLPMLVAQAVKSAELFTGERFDTDFIENVYRKTNISFKNILIIGMPGCGKTTIGRILSAKTGRPLIDLDEEIEKRTGRSPAAIIRESGEPSFRDIETDVLREVSSLSGKIISCGGGVISPKRNRFIMRRNSNVVWIQRDIHLLETKGRPLSEMIGTHELYRYREPLYIESADYTVTNNGSPEDAADRILEVLGT